MAKLINLKRHELVSNLINGKSYRTEDGYIITLSINNPRTPFIKYKDGVIYRLEDTWENLNNLKEIKFNIETTEP